MRRPVLFSGAQLLLLMLQVAALTVAIWILVFGAPWDEPQLAHTVTVTGQPHGRPGSSGAQP